MKTDVMDPAAAPPSVPDPKAPIDAGGFLKDNEDGKRERNPRFCNVPGGAAVKDQTYIAAKC